MEKYIIELSRSEQEITSGGTRLPGNIWELLGFLWQSQYNGFEANDFAPAVMPYK